MLSLYNRNLLSNFAVEDILRLLNEAQAFIETDLLDLSPTLKHALTIRLEVRLCMLMAVDVDKSSERGRADDWGCCIAILPDLKETRPCGKPVESSFSAKLQRKLASTVPPRLIVKITFDEAWDLLNRICGCGRDAYLILDYHGGSRLQVCSKRNFLRFYDLGMLMYPAELSMVIPIANATASCVHSLSTSVIDLFRNESTQQLIYQATAPG